MNYYTNMDTIEVFKAVFIVYSVLLSISTGWFVWFNSFKSKRLEEKVKRGNNLFDLAIFTTLLRIVGNEDYTRALEEMTVAAKLGIFDVAGATKASSKAVSKISKEVKVLFKLFVLKRSLNRNWRLLKRRAYKGMVISASALGLVLSGFLLTVVLSASNPFPYLVAGFAISLGGIGLFELVLSYIEYNRVQRIVMDVVSEVYSAYVGSVVKRR
ncbi:MAG: hypothetical protein ACP5HQ_05505 [Thermoprotei archaeon]